MILCRCEEVSVGEVRAVVDEAHWELNRVKAHCRVGMGRCQGVPVEYAQPKEGAVVLNVAECAIAHNDQPELAQKLAAFLLTPEAQAPALEEGDQIPSNPKTPTTDKTRARVEAMNTYQQTAISIDWDQVSQQRPEWNTRWSKTIER